MSRRERLALALRDRGIDEIHAADVAQWADAVRDPLYRWSECIRLSGLAPGQVSQCLAEAGYELRRTG